MESFLEESRVSYLSPDPRSCRLPRVRVSPPLHPPYRRSSRPPVSRGVLHLGERNNRRIADFARPRRPPVRFAETSKGKPLDDKTVLGAHASGRKSSPCRGFVKSRSARSSRTMPTRGRRNPSSASSTNNRDTSTCATRGALINTCARLYPSHALSPPVGMVSEQRALFSWPPGIVHSPPELQKISNLAEVPTDRCPLPCHTDTRTPQPAPTRRLLMPSIERCEVPSCEIRPHYGYDGEAPRFCAQHRAEGMHNLRSRRCQVHADCTTTVVPTDLLFMCTCKAP